MPDAETDFRRAIAAAPLDDDVRLIFADWLDEQGRDRQAKFIRDQVRYRGHLTREDILLGGMESRGRWPQMANKKVWDMEFHRVTTPSKVQLRNTGQSMVVFRGGFVEVIRVPYGEYSRSMGGFRTNPIQKVIFSNLPLLPDSAGRWRCGPSHTSRLICFRLKVDRTFPSYDEAIETVSRAAVNRARVAIGFDPLYPD